MEVSLLQQLSIISEAIERQQAVAVVGAGVSAGPSYEGEQKDLGLPTGQGMVDALSKRRNYVQKSLSFSEAALLIKQREGRLALVEMLQDMLDVGGSPLSSHHTLARLPFVAYVSYNFDELLEEALRAAGRSPHQVVSDTDVALARPGSVTVIKPNGTLSQPDTIRAASDEIIGLDMEKPLVLDLLRTTIAQRRLLYLGFSLTDPDFIYLHHSVIKSLGKYVPTSTAVVLSATEHEIAYWGVQGVSIIQSDLFGFLHRLAAVRDYGRDENGGSYLMLEADPWLQDPFFQRLLAIRSLPSETQVIDALVTQVEDEARTSDPRDLAQRVRRAISLVLEYRPNFAALGRVGEGVAEMIEASSNRRQLEEALRGFRLERRDLGEELGQRAARWINEGDQLFVYSQSKRITETLRTVIPAVQETCTLYIAECRPKSPTSFQDAYAVYEELKDTQYRIRLIPDIAFAHLVERKLVNKVLMGAHQLCLVNSKIRYFVNTCGALTIARVCDWYDLPLIIVAEADKIEEFADEQGLNKISFSPEENLSRAALMELSRYRTVASGLRIDNYGYDIVPVTSNVLIVSSIDLGEAAIVER